MIDLTLTTILSWVVLGFIIGLIVHLIDPGNVRGGFVGTTLLGILGAFVGGIVANLYLNTDIAAFSLEGIVIGIVGALILSLLYRLFFRKTGRIKTETKRLR